MQFRAATRICRPPTRWDAGAEYEKHPTCQLKIDSATAGGSLSEIETTVAMTAKGAHATLEVSVPTATSLIEIDIPNRSFRSLPQHVRGTAQTP